MKFSTSAILAVAAFAGSAKADDCGSAKPAPPVMPDYPGYCMVETVSMVGDEDGFGGVLTCPGEGHGAISTTFGGQVIKRGPSNNGQAGEFGDAGVVCNGANDNTNPCVDNVNANAWVNFKGFNGANVGATDMALNGDFSYTHEIEVPDCGFAGGYLETYHFGLGFDMAATLTVDGQDAGVLADGDLSTSAVAGDQSAVYDYLPISGGTAAASALSDGVGTFAVDTKAQGFNTDTWALDYSKLVLWFKCPCTAETQPDPHFKTFRGDWFDFHGGCDIVLIDVPDYDNQAGLAVNIRTTVRYAYSFIESLAIKVGEDILQVSGWGDYILNGISNADLEGATLNGLPVKREVISEKQFKFIVTLANGHHFTIKVFKDMISTNFDLPEEHDVRGILGDRSGAKLARDGVTVIEDANEFGQEWQVQDTDHQLFQTVREPQFPAKCIMPDPVEREKRRLSATVSQEAAEAACSHIKDEHVRDMCIFDVISVDDLSLAAGAY